MNTRNKLLTLFIASASTCLLSACNEHGSKADETVVYSLETEDSFANSPQTPKPIGSTSYYSTESNNTVVNSQDGTITLTDATVLSNISSEGIGVTSTSTETYQPISENHFQTTQQQPLSTFSIDVDNASYSNVRRFLNNNQLPPANAVRIEEMINYFDYAYEESTSNHPFSIATEVASCPWNENNQLVHIGIKGKSIAPNAVKANNLVFLIDASGSMNDNNKLPLLKKSFNLLIENLNENDRIAIVAYAGAAGLVLPSTEIRNASTIINALNHLEAGGSTAGGAGIELAYEVAKENFIKNGNNRVILATDGDFNVGTSSANDLVKLIEAKRNENIFLTICGMGMGNYKDYQMEALSNAGNGNYFYIDNILEAKKVFVDDLQGNLFTIAKDVKIQIEFNPTYVQSYRLIGYENRLLATEDFENDLKDAGELGAGHTVTALYEIVPASQKGRTTSRLKYQQSKPTKAAQSNEVATIKFRYKNLKARESTLIEQTIRATSKEFNSAGKNLRFSSTVAAFGLLLRNSAYRGTLTYPQLIKMVNAVSKNDPHGLQQEFAQLVKKAALLSK